MGGGSKQRGNQRTAASRRNGDPSTSTAALHAFFLEQYGSTRWKKLAVALLSPVRHVAVLNAWTNANADVAWQQACALTHGPIQCFRRLDDSDSRYEPPAVDPDTGLRTHYWLDLASVLPAALLDVHPGQRVLDMCAAPGGKTFLIAMQLFSHRLHPRHTPASSQATAAQAQHPARSRLVANEVDAARSRRLAGVLAEYLPLDLLSGGEEACVRVLNKPADTYFKRQDEESYDRVLLDAPCSSDRHILQQAAGTARTGATGAVAEWSVAGCKRIAALQLQLLLAGLRALSPGGKLVYSTCSMADMENDGVVAAALARMPEGAVQVCPIMPTLAQDSGCGSTPDSSPAAAAAQPLLPPYMLQGVLGAEATRYGVLVLPDAQGAGPIYACVLTKTRSTAGVTAAVRLGLQQLSLESDTESDGEAGKLDVEHD